MPTQIQSYALAWNPNNNRRFISLLLADNSRVHVPVDSGEEFIAIAAVLNQSPVYIYPDGTIAGSDHVGWNQ